MLATIQTGIFSQQVLYDTLLADCAQTPGAIVTFTGLVRDFNADGPIEGMSLEHYPGMTERALVNLATQAIDRFSLHNAGIVHRVGTLANHEQIVWVGTAASHRKAAFNAASYMMDTLKSSVPLWKKEFQQGSAHWVDAKNSDAQAALSWLDDSE